MSAIPRVVYYVFANVVFLVVVGDIVYVAFLVKQGSLKQRTPVQILGGLISGEYALLLLPPPLPPHSALPLMKKFGQLCKAETPAPTLLCPNGDCSGADQDGPDHHRPPRLGQCRDDLPRLPRPEPGPARHTHAGPGPGLT